MQEDPARTVASPCSRRPVKRGVSRATPTPGPRVEWREVLRAAQGDQARLDVTCRYRAWGFTADDFEHSSLARKAACDALTYAEDALEMRCRGKSTAERLAMRSVRRRLEWELHP